MRPGGAVSAIRPRTTDGFVLFCLRRVALELPSEVGNASRRAPPDRLATHDITCNTRVGAKHTRHGRIPSPGAGNNRAEDCATSGDEFQLKRASEGRAGSKVVFNSLTMTKSLVTAHLGHAPSSTTSRRLGATEHGWGGEHKSAFKRSYLRRGYVCKCFCERSRCNVHTMWARYHGIVRYPATRRRDTAHYALSWQPAGSWKLYDIPPVASARCNQASKQASNAWRPQEHRHISTMAKMSFQRAKPLSTAMAGRGLNNLRTLDTQTHNDTQ